MDAKSKYWLPSSNPDRCIFKKVKNGKANERMVVQLTAKEIESHKKRSRTTPDD